MYTSQFVKSTIESLSTNTVASFAYGIRNIFLWIVFDKRGFNKSLLEKQ